MKKVKITQVKSVIGQNKKQKATMEALGLKRIKHTVEHTLTPAIAGMVKKINHLINIQ